MPIVWQMPDGSVQVTTVVPAVIERERREGETTADTVARYASVIQDKVPHLAGAVLTLVRSADMPTSRRFRNAWRVRANAVNVDLPAARNQRMNEIRVERDKRLAASDVAWTRAQDIGTPQETAALRQYRQALRDLPANVNLDDVATADDLATFEPAWPVSPA